MFMIELLINTLGNFIGTLAAAVVAWCFASLKVWKLPTWAQRPTDAEQGMLMYEGLTQKEWPNPEYRISWFRRRRLKAWYKKRHEFTRVDTLPDEWNPMKK